eukprot:SAG31_NODE_3895_length_3773_cov_21.681818_3_plen_139_part_00
MPPAPYHWELRNGQSPWRPRDGAGLLSFNGSLFMLGGWRYRSDVPSGPGGLLDQKFENTIWTVDSEVWRSDDDGKSWQNVTARAGWPGRHTFGHVVHNAKMFVVGGDIYSDTNDVRALLIRPIYSEYILNIYILKYIF